MKRRIALPLTLLMLSMVGILPLGTVEANPINQKAGYEVITIASPQSLTFSSSNRVTLFFKCHTNFVANYLSYCYTMDGSGATLYGNLWGQMLKVEQKIINQTVISNDTSNSRTEPYLPYTDYEIEIKAILSSLRDGNHKMSLYRGPNYDFSGAMYSSVLNVTFTVNTSTDETKNLRIIKISPDITPSPSPSLPSNSPTPTVPEFPAFALTLPATAFISLVFFKRRKSKTA